MKPTELVDIIIKEVYKEQQIIMKDLFYEVDIEKTSGLPYKMKEIFNKCDDNEQKVILKYFNSISDDNIAVLLSILDEWGGGYFDDGEDNDGHFEIYYVSDEKDKYKYRVDENITDLFLEKIEEINESKEK